MEDNKTVKETLKEEKLDTVTGGWLPFSLSLFSGIEHHHTTNTPPPSINKN